jgi:RimJ/RimL family protein N-acetyltransferase
LVERKIEESPNEKYKIFSHFLDLIKKLCFLDLKLFKLWAETYANRGHHISILEANGLQLEGRLRSHVIIDGKRVDSLIHSILIREWNKEVD